MWLFFYCPIFQLDRSTRELELGLEYGPPVMNIGGQTWRFEQGLWTSGTDDFTNRELQIALHVITFLKIKRENE